MKKAKKATRLSQISKIFAVVLAAALIVTSAIVPASASSGLTARVVSFSMSLDSRIGLNFYVELPDDIRNSDASYVRLFDYSDPSMPETVIYVSEVRDDIYIYGASGQYRCNLFTYYVAAQQIYNSIGMELYTGNGDEKVEFLNGSINFGTVFRYSPSHYLSGTFSDESMASLAKAIAEYGTAAQRYFHYDLHQSDAIPDGIASTGPINDYAVAADGTLPQGITNITTSMVLDSDNSVKMYINCAEGYRATDYSYSLDGTNVVPEARGSRYVIEISGIVAKDLGKEHFLIISDDWDVYTVTFSAMSYAAFISRKNDDRASVLGKAIGNYYTAAVNYFGTGSPRTNHSFRYYGLASHNELVTINNVLDQYASEMTMDRLEMVRSVHDWMVRHIAYDYSFTKSSASDALAGSSVCDGYTKLFNIFMSELGIPSQRITGTATNSLGNSESHSWNAVQMDDGKWYYVDVTWDDPTKQVTGGQYPYSSDFPDGRNLRYDYFLVTEAVIGADHVADTVLPSPAGTGMSYNTEATSRLASEELDAFSARIVSENLSNAYALYNFENDYSNMITGLKLAIADDAFAGGTKVKFTVYAIGGQMTVNELFNKIWSDTGSYASERYADVVTMDTNGLFSDGAVIKMSLWIGIAIAEF